MATDTAIWLSTANLRPLSFFTVIILIGCQVSCQACFQSSRWVQMRRHRETRLVSRQFSLNQAEVSTRTCKVLFSWFSTLDNGFLTFLFILFYFTLFHGEGVALSRPCRSSHGGRGRVGTLILTSRDVLSWNKIWRSSCAWGSACM